jgi:RimJ/RimL family protein N-acetyltransferase
MEENNYNFNISFEEADSKLAKKISDMNKGSLDYNPLKNLNFDDSDFVENQTTAMKELYKLLISIEQAERKVYAIKNCNFVIGYIGFVNFNSITPEIQIELIPKFQNQGYGYASLSEFLDEIFNNPNIQYVIYRVAQSNIPSIRLVEKLGGVLQKTDNKVEEVLLKTYHIYK